MRLVILFEIVAHICGSARDALSRRSVGGRNRSRVFWRELVAALAVRLSKLRGACNGGPYTLKSAASIFGRCDWFQVARINAAPNSTQMVNLKPSRNGSDEHFVGDSVREIRAFVSVRLRSHGELAVTAVCLATSGPQPTAGIRLGADVFQEAGDYVFSCGNIKAGHVTPFSRVALGLLALQRLRAFLILPQQGFEI